MVYVSHKSEVFYFEEKMSSYTAGTYSAKPNEVKQAWYLVDAQDLVLGRMSAEVAKILRGKHKPYYTPHIDCGDHVVIINAEKIHLSGKKDVQSKYYWHTGYVGGIKETTPKKTLDGNFPERVVKRAILRMMPKESPLATNQYKGKLHVYAGSEHPHMGQNPQMLDLASKNTKNKK